jgi:hypothetical protein
MTDAPQVFAAKQCALEFAAYLKRTHAVELPMEAIIDMARRIHQVIVSETDEHLGCCAGWDKYLPRCAFHVS